ncbi:MAG: cytochrome b N-terminal domain-containing protein, partial [Anaerolineales bacterium]|nr:cytochrome b N-terminal domain-containing protein [Anaerolineales bacterium]
WDQLAYWALTVFISGAEAAPAPAIINQNVLLILQGAPSLGAGGLLRWYLLHVLLMPLMLGILFFVHYYKVVLHGMSLPPGREEIGEDTAKRVPKNERTYFIPDLLTSELMWSALMTLFLVAGALWLWDAPLETHANPVVTPLHVVAPWYLSWSQGWLKLADKTLVVGFIPALLVAFIVMPYFEVGKSRRYADRRVGLSVAFLFMAFMLVSNWMGTPEYRVASSPDREVSIEILPQEGASTLLAVPYDEMLEGSFLPGQDLGENYPHLNEALADLAHAVLANSCTVGAPKITTIEASEWKECDVVTLENGDKQYNTTFGNDLMPDPYVLLEIEEVQPKLLRLTLVYDVPEPDNPNEFRIQTSWTAYRHADSNYEEECRYANKNC